MPPLGPGARMTDTLTLVRVIGEGGMGTVWLAEHHALGSEVAVKVMHPELARRDPALVERFTAEARAAARVRHPNIVQILDQGTTEDGVAWLSMELLEGVSLRARLAPEEPASADAPTDAFMAERALSSTTSHAVEPSFALEVVMQASGALAKAHAAGIVHRDLKPENLFVMDVAGRPFIKVLDFGIAKSSFDGRVETATTSVFGTPAYMGPEQLKSAKNVDAQADLWSLAVVAYELLTGELPFSGDTASAVVLAVAAGEFELPSAREGGLGTAVDAFFRRAFAKEPAARFESAEEFASCFARALEGRPVTDGWLPGVGLRSTLDGGGGSERGAELPRESASSDSAARGPVATTGTETDEGAQDDGALPESESSPPIRSLRTRVETERASAAAKWTSKKTVTWSLALLGAAAAAIGLARARGAEGSTATEDAPSSSVPSSTSSLASATTQAAVPLPPSESTPAAQTIAHIEGGTFDMGSDESSDEKPIHHVKVEPFALDRTEVTVAAYLSCVQDGACTPAKTGGRCNAGVAGRDAHPINCVDWNQATAYCSARGQRLPTEEEWEYASRGEEGRKFPWGDDEPGEQLCWRRFGEGKPNSTCPVGAFPSGRSSFGVLDMAGNVWEWTSSGTSTSYSAEREPHKRIVRGGSWSNDEAHYVRSTDRYRYEPNVQSGGVGFRCAGEPRP